MEKAAQFLREKGLARAEKRSGRATSEGVVDSYIHMGGRIGVLVEVRCATDFVANTEQFQTLCKELALQVAGAGEEDLLNQPYVRDPSKTVKDLITSVSQQVDEPVSVKRAIRWELT